VNLIHKQPSRDPQYEADFGLGLPNQRLIHAGAQGPAGDLFSYRVDVGQVTHEDFRGATTERNQASAALRFTPDSRNTLQLRVGLSYDHYNTDVGIPTVEDPAHPGTWHLPPGSQWSNRYGTNNDHIDYRRIDLSADYRYDITHETYLKARLSLVDDHYEYLAAEEQTYVPGSDTMPAQVNRDYLYFTRGWTPVVGQLELHSDANTGPLHHKFALGYEFNYFGGVTDRGDEGGVMPSAIDFAHPIDTSPAVSLQRTSQDHYRHVTNSFYAFDHIHLLDNLIATGGVRADLVNSRVQRVFLDRELQTVTVDPDTGSPRAAIKDHADAVTGQFGVVYTPVAPLTTYVSYSSSFLPAFVYPSDSSANTFRPERGQQVEGGVRLRISEHAHTLQLDTAVYYIQKRNVVIPLGPDDYTQAGKVRSRGFDVSVRYSAPRFIELDASYAYTLATFQDYVSPDPVTGDNVSRKGNQVGFAPRHGVNAWLRLLFTKNVGIGLGMRVMAKQYADNENRLPMPDYALVDASAFIRGEYASFVLSVSNVLDVHDYYSSVINTFNANPQVTPGPGRELMGTLRLTY
jgi:iron complex outermembrane receptor protein